MPLPPALREFVNRTPALSRLRSQWHRLRTKVRRLGQTSRSLPRSNWLARVTLSHSGKLKRIGELEGTRRDVAANRVLDFFLSQRGVGELNARDTGFYEPLPQLKLEKTPLVAADFPDGSLVGHVFGLTPHQLRLFLLYCENSGQTPREAVQHLFRRAIQMVPPHRLGDEMLSNLEIADCGHRDVLSVWLRLASGEEFVGYRSEPKYANAYQVYRSFLPEILDAETYQLAVEVQDRYFRAMRKPPLFPGPGGVAIEAGAYIGIKTVRSAKTWLEGKGRMLAVEVDRTNAELLAENVRRNGLEDVITPVHAGLFSHDGVAINRHHTNRRHFLTTTDDWSYAEVMETEVPALTMDTLIDSHGLRVVDHINIQVNGAEVEVLKGLDRRFDDVRAFGIAAYYAVDGQPLVDTVRAMLKERGCRIVSQSRLGFIHALTPRGLREGVTGIDTEPILRRAQRMEEKGILAA